MCVRAPGRVVDAGSLAGFSFRAPRGWGDSVRVELGDVVSVAAERDDERERSLAFVALRCVGLLLVR